MKAGEAWALIKESVTAWMDDYAPSMGAALAYYTVFSIAPLLIIVISVAGLVFGHDAVQGQIVAQLGGLVGDEGATAIEGLIKSASDPARGILGTIVGVAVLIIGATTVVAELQDALDRVWRVPLEDRPSGLMGLLRTRLVAFGLVLGLGFLALVSLILSAGVAAFGAWFGGMFEGWEVLLQALNLIISVALSAGLFAMIYKLMPSVPIAWRDVWIGAVVTAVLFEIGKILIGLYIGKSGVTSGFGAAGSIVVLLVWVYCSAQIFLLGAEFTWVYARRHGSHIGHATAEDKAGAPGEVPQRSQQRFRGPLASPVGC
jgi:membrane protein